MKTPTLANRLTAICLATFIVLLSPGCAQTTLQREAVAASTIAAVANVSLEALGRIYDADLTDAITAAALAEDAAASTQRRTPCRKCAMDAAEVEVNQHWTPIWGDPASEIHLGAWEIFRMAHAAWADQIEAGEAKSALGIRANAAYCDLLPLVPVKYRAAIAVVGIACPAPVEVIR